MAAFEVGHRAKEKLDSKFELKASKIFFTKVAKAALTFGSTVLKPRLTQLLLLLSFYLTFNSLIIKHHSRTHSWGSKETFLFSEWFKVRCVKLSFGWLSFGAQIWSSAKSPSWSSEVKTEVNFTNLPIY